MLNCASELVTAKCQEFRIFIINNIWLWQQWWWTNIRLVRSPVIQSLLVHVCSGNNEKLVVFIFYDFEKTVRKTGWSVRGFWVIIERFSRRSRENLEIITQKPRTDHPVFRTVCLRSHRMWNILFLGSCFPSQVKKFFIAVKKTTHIQGKYF